MPFQLQLTQARAFIDAIAAWAALALPRLVAAAALLLAGIWLAGWAARQAGRLLDRQTRIDPTLRGVVTSVVRYTLLVVVLVAVLGQLGVQTTSLLAALGAAGLAVGLALQGTLSNIAAGMMLLWLRPFRVGDYITAGTVSGTVKEVGLFVTEMHSWDGVYQMVPNGELWNKSIVNYSRLPTRLIEAKFGVGYGDDIAKGQAVLLALARADPRVLADPEPIVFVDTLGDSAVELALRAWSATPDYWPTLRALNEQGKAALEAAGLTIPYPQRDVHIHGSAPARGLHDAR